VCLSGYNNNVTPCHDAATRSQPAIQGCITEQTFLNGGQLRPKTDCGFLQLTSVLPCSPALCHAQNKKLTQSHDNLSVSIPSSEACRQLTSPTSLPSTSPNSAQHLPAHFCKCFCLQQRQSCMVFFVLPECEEYFHLKLRFSCVWKNQFKIISIHNAQADTCFP
jgi:hypothetical protein